MKHSSLVLVCLALSAKLYAQTPGMMLLMVDKAKLSAELYRWPENKAEAELLTTLRIAIGRSEGDKQHKGDNRTPEGIYFTQQIMNDTELPAKYGPKAIPINFPNAFDRILGKTGHGIWLHGNETDARINEAKVTEGCVAFYNRDITELSQILKPAQAIVMIAAQKDSLNKEEDWQSLRERTDSWAKDWATRNVNGYMGHYSSQFKSRGMNWVQYKNYKEQVFKGYKNMMVKLDKIHVFTHERYGLTVMDQDFNGDNRFKAKGRKVLYWQKMGPGEWRIVHEDFDSRALRLENFNRSQLKDFVAFSPSTKFFESRQGAKKL